MHSLSPIGVAFGAAAGLYHPAPGRRAALICPAPGYEGLVARRGMAALARRLAAAGLPALLLDYAGDGDGGEGELTPASMTADARRALDALRHAGAERVTLIGFRFGAAVAAALAAARGEVDELALLAPPVDGQEHLREWRALERFMRRPGRAPALDGAGLGGFSASPYFLAQAGAFRLCDVDLTGLKRILVAAGPGARSMEALAALWAASGAAITARRFEGYDEFMCDATASRLPDTAFASLVDWAAVSRRPGKAPALESTPLDGGVWRETRFACADADFAGVLTRPAQARRALVLLNAGRVPHQGWARQNVALARRLAGESVTTLRLDLPGVGDSPVAERDLYDPGQTQRLAAVFDALAAEGIDRIAVGGLCSGGYHAFYAAMADPRVDIAFAVNLPTFAMRATQSVELAAWAEAKRRGAAADRRAGAEAAEGLAHALPLARRAAKQTLAALDSLLARAGALSGRTQATREALRAYLERGGALRLVHAAGDISLAEAERELGPLLAEPGVGQITVEDCDHEFTPAAARARLGDHIAATLAAPGRARVAA